MKFHVTKVKNYNMINLILSGRHLNQDKTLIYVSIIIYLEEPWNKKAKEKYLSLYLSSLTTCVVMVKKFYFPRRMYKIGQNNRIKEEQN